MKREYQHKLLSKAKAVVTKYNRMLREKKHHFGDGFRDMGRVIHALENTIERAEGRDPNADKRRREYEVKAKTGTGRTDKEQSEHHESFGMLQINRTHGGRGQTRLFGSHLSYHRNTISLRIHRAYRVFHLSSEWYHHEPDAAIIEIEMSKAQFAEAITSLNAGSGVPCTIRDIEGEVMEDLPDEHVPENVIIAAEFENEIEHVVERLKNKLDELDEILDKKRINKADREHIRGIVSDSVRLLDDSAPFMVRSFGQSVSKVVTTAKAEVEAWITNSLVSAGMESIKGAKRIAAKATKQLTTGSSK